jgi:hypothetical protein
MKRDDPLQSVRKWYDLLAAYWRSSYKAGTILVVDETMVFWTGQEVHLTDLPRKPTPLGVMLKTICDGASGVFLGWEFTEGKYIDQQKRWCAEYGAGTSTTLRLTQPWHGSNRILLGDSWLGSLKCCIVLLERELYSVMNVQTAHKTFPKQQCLFDLNSRGDVMWYRLRMHVHGEERRGGYLQGVFAGYLQGVTWTRLRW